MINRATADGVRRRQWNSLVEVIVVGNLDGSCDDFEYIPFHFVDTPKGNSETSGSSSAKQIWPDSVTHLPQYLGER